MSLELYNTLTRQKEPFKPQKKTVSLYTCGPTVYAAAHIGNLRTYVFEDTLRRWLEHGHGLKVNQMMNITDVEDKIIANSKAETVEEMQLYTEPFEEQFFADLALLGIEPAELYPRATESIPQMIALIEQIIKAGYAYERDGSVYFDVEKYHEDHTYGRLLKVDFAGFEDHHRIDNDEYDKESVQDFALWKAVSKDSPGWDSPWGYGRPGWHIECSAMAGELGLPIDIHAGAVDLTFPHHENEIAQTKAATDKQLAKTWLHAEHLLVDGAKMAKSAGNFYTLADITEKGHGPVALRMLFLQSHYRSKLNFTWVSLAAANEGYERIQEFLQRLYEHKPEKVGKSIPSLMPELNEDRKLFDKAMDDDLNTPEAFSVVFNLITVVNYALDHGQMRPEELKATKELFGYFNNVLGVLEFDPVEIETPEAVQKLVDEREQARKNDDFEAADRLRQKIEKAGFTLEDTPNGPRLRKK